MAMTNFGSVGKSKFGENFPKRKVYFECFKSVEVKVMFKIAGMRNVSKIY
jgi:hypothetical protein